MALGIKREGSYDVLTIPLEWENNEILANHFRMLADEIESSQISVQRAAIVGPINGDPYDKICLEIIGFNKTKLGDQV